MLLEYTDVSLFNCLRLVLLEMLILIDEIGEVGSSFGELHLIHAFSQIPVQESLTFENCFKLFP